MRIRGLVATLAGTAALVGLAAAPLGAAPPSVATPYPQAGLADKGACFGISVGTAKNPNGIKTGLTLNNGPASIAVKGEPASTAEADAGTMGACLLSPDLGVTTPAPTVTKFSARLSSEVTDCNLSDNDTAELPLMGKIAWDLDTNADGEGDTKIGGYVRITGPDTQYKELAWVTGMVTKGDAVGATIGGAVFFAPVLKSDYATGTYLNPNRFSQPDGNGGTLVFNSVAPDYGYNQVWAYNTGNCGAWGPVSGTPNVQWILFGAGYSSTLGHVSPGFHFLI